MEETIKDTDYEKMRGIIDRILEHPDFHDVEKTISESKILRFYINNEKQFIATFKKPENFPHMIYLETKALFFTVLTDLVIDWLKPRVDKIINMIDFSFTQPLLGEKHSVLPMKLKNFFLESIKEKEVRSDYLGTRNVILMNYLNRYLKEFKHRRGYGTKEIFKIKGLTDIAHYENFYKCCAILRNLAKMRLPLKHGNAEKHISYKDTEDFQSFRDDYFHALEKEISEKFGEFPVVMINVSLSSVIKQQLLKDRFEAGGQLLEILVERSKSFVQLGKQDARGAEPPDKSWFNTARRNIKYYEFNSTFLDGLYFIAGDNRW